MATSTATGMSMLLGSWDLGDAGSDGSYAAPARLDPPVWRTTLPEDPVAASQRLLEVAAVVDTAELARAAAMERLSAFVAGSASGEGVAFAVGSGQGTPEAELALAIDAVSGGGTMSFGIRDTLTDYWDRAVNAFHETVGRLARLLSGQVWVETVVADRLACRTVVGLGGDMSTLWHGVPSASTVSLHRGSLDGALGSRMAILRTIGSVISGAALLATLPALLASPAGILLALPAAWRFVSQVMDGT